MSETIFMMRGHWTKWQIAYIKWALYVAAAILPSLYGELKGYPSFGEISPMAWFLMFIDSLYLGVTTTIAFMSKASQTPKDDKKTNETSTTI